MIERGFGSKEYDEDDIIIPLELEDGSILDCHVIAVFDYKDNSYIALLPDGTTEIMLFRYNEIGYDEMSLENIEDEREFEQVLDYFDSLLDEVDDDDIDEL